MPIYAPRSFNTLDVKPILTMGLKYIPYNTAKPLTINMSFSGLHSRQSKAALLDKRSYMHTYIYTLQGVLNSKLFRMSKFSAFCDSTSLHGWPHIPGSSTLEKIFWGVTILTMGGLAIYLCNRCSVQKY